MTNNKTAPVSPLTESLTEPRTGEPPSACSREPRQWESGARGDLHEPQATSSRKEPGPRTLASSFPSAVGSTKPKTAQSGGAVRASEPVLCPRCPSQDATALSTVTFPFQYHRTATSNRVHREGCTNL